MNEINEYTALNKINNLLPSSSSPPVSPRLIVLVFCSTLHICQDKTWLFPLCHGLEAIVLTLEPTCRYSHNFDSLAQHRPGNNNLNRRGRGGYYTMMIRGDKAQWLEIKTEIYWIVITVMSCQFMPSQAVVYFLVHGILLVFIYLEFIVPNLFCNSILVRKEKPIKTLYSPALILASTESNKISTVLMILPQSSLIVKP